MMKGSRPPTPMASPWSSPEPGISATSAIRTSVGLLATMEALDRPANPLLEFLLRLRADLARRQLAVLEQHQGRNRHDAVFGRRPGVLIDIKLDDFDLAIERVGNLFKRGRNHPAGAAPFRPEINDDRTARLENVPLERGIGDLLDHGIPRLLRESSVLGKSAESVAQMNRGLNV